MFDSSISILDVQKWRASSAVRGRVGVNQRDRGEEQTGIGAPELWNRGYMAIEDTDANFPFYYQILHLHIGQAGTQLGNSAWEL